MIELKNKTPIEIDGIEYADRILHWAEDKNGNKYKIKQKETGVIYDSAIDVLPCKYTYEATDEKIIEEE